MRTAVVIILLVFVISFASAVDVTLSPSSLSATVTQGQSTQVTIGYTANNPTNNSDSVSVSLNNAPNFITSSISLINVPANTQVTGNIIFTISPTDLNTPQTYSFTMFVGNTALQSTVIVNADLTGQCRIYVPISTNSKTLSSGEQSTQTLQIFVSQYCSTPLQVSNNQPQMTKPISWNSMTGQVNPSGSFSLIVNYDTINVQKGTYSDTIVISGVDGYENLHTLSIPLSLTVSSSISPLTNGSFTNFPVCSVSGVDLSLNSSYKLSCTDIPANIKIAPQIDTAFLEGINVEEIGNTYTYFFKPKAVGNTEIFANFLFGTANIGTPFRQSLRIFQGDNIVSGTNMSFRFYPELYQAKENDEIIVNVIDTKTGNLLTDAKIFLNGNQINNGTITLQYAKTFELRATNYGYNDLVQSISLVSNPISFNLSSSYSKGDILDFVTDPVGATISLNDAVISLPFTLSEAGKFNVSASLTGYTTTTKEINVEDKILIKYDTEVNNPTAFKKGGTFVLTLDKESVITADYYDAKKQKSELLTPIRLTPTEIEIETKKEGSYTIYSNGEVVKQFTLGESGAVKWYQGEWLGVPKWIFGILILFVIILFIKMFFTSTPVTTPPYVLQSG